MKKVRVGINGMGRIGRTLLREYFRKLRSGEQLPFEIVAINNLGSLTTLAHLLEFDSVHRHEKLQINVKENELMVNGQVIQFSKETTPQLIPWDKYNVQIVIDSTGVFKDREALSQHLKGSVSKVVMCAPGKKLDGTFVMGINHLQFDAKKHSIISNASCTTNCLAPVVKVLDDAFGIENGFMTTVHSYTSDQNLLDNSHSDLRRARAAALSMIPTTTGAAKALGEVLPSMAGKLDGYAVRVPTPDVSMIDLTVNLQKPASKELINQAMKQASLTGPLKGYLGYTEQELVSIDFMGRPESSIFDAPLTNVIGRTAKVVSWYDNEIGFSHRVLDLVAHVGVQTWA